VSVFHKLIKGDDCTFSMVGSFGREMYFTRINHETNKHIINAKIAICEGVQASSEFAFDARMVKHAIRHGAAGVPELPSVFGDGFTVTFEHWNDYTNFCQFCNISPEIFNEQLRPLSSTSINIVEVGRDTTLMQNPCVTLSWNGQNVEHITLIKLKESTVSEPSLMFQVCGGVSSDQIHFYSGPDLHDVYSELKRVLKPQGIKFDSTLTD